MPSFDIHLAVGKRYIKKNNIKDKYSFMKGTIAPDLVPDKDKSHYTQERDNDTVLTHLKTKIYLPKFLKENEINTDYMKGVFLHLITDFLFFNDFLKKDYLSNISYNEFFQDLYYSYDLSNNYLREKYNIDFKSFIEENSLDLDKEKLMKTYNKNHIRKNILDFKELDDFIERVSSIDLEEYKKKVLETNQNIII